MDLQFYFIIVYGQQITQFISVALLSCPEINDMFLFFKFYVGQ